MATIKLSAMSGGAWGNVIPLVASNTTSLVTSAATLLGGVDKPAGLTDFDTGRQTFEIIGDDWQAGETDALTAITAVVNSEQGYFFVARDGTFVFRNAAWFDARIAAPRVVFDNVLADYSGELNEDDVYNQVVLEYRPRARKAQGVVAQATTSLVAPGQSGYEKYTGKVVNQGGGTASYRLPYIDPDTGEPMAAESIIVPQRAIDYEAWEFEGKQGGNYTNSPVLTVSAANFGNEVEITFKNTALGPLHIYNLRVRGIGLVSYDPVQIRREDASSVALYGKRPVPIELPYATDPNFVEAVAQRAIADHSVPRFRVERITIDNPLAKDAALFDIDLGSVLAVTEDQLGLTSDPYVVLGQSIEFSADRVTSLVLEIRPLDRDAYWVLDDATYAVLGTTTVLGL